METLPKLCVCFQTLADHEAPKTSCNASKTSPPLSNSSLNTWSALANEPLLHVPILPEMQQQPARRINPFFSVPDDIIVRWNTFSVTNNGWLKVKMHHKCTFHFM